MPTYQYRCKDCGADLEVVQKFTDDALTDCPSCEGGELRKIFNAVGVVFKGSGFYRTDSRAGSADSKSTGGSGSSSAEKASGGADSKSSGSAAPATAGSAN